MGGGCSAEASGEVKSGGIMIKKASDVAKHNNAKDCWIIIKGLIYDVTPFLKQHPGGAQMILLYAGKDASAAFNGVHTHTSYAKSLLEQYHIGYLPDMAPKPGTVVAAPPAYKVGVTLPDPDFKWTFELGKIDKLTLDTSLFHFTATSANGANKFSLTPGQHVYVNIPGVGEKPYTPTDHGGGTMSLIVKTYASGVVSAAIHRLAVGAAINVRAPASRLDWKSIVDGKYGFIGMIAGGTGITPMIQIIRGILESTEIKTPPRMSLIVSNKTDDDALFRAQLMSVAQSKPSVLTITWISSQANGHITEAAVTTAWQDALLTIDTGLALVCGPPSFTTDMTTICESIGFPRDSHGEKSLYIF